MHATVIVATQSTRSNLVYTDIQVFSQQVTFFLQQLVNHKSVHLYGRDGQTLIFYRIPNVNILHL